MRRLLPFGIAALTLGLAGCSKIGGGPTPVPGTQELPQQELHDAQITFYEEDRLNAVLQAGRIRKFERTAMVLLDSGVIMDFYNEQGQHTTRLWADSGRTDEVRREMEAMGHVVAKSDSGQTLETSRLRWDNRSRQVRSDVNVKLSTPSDTIYGIGFLADEHLRNWKIDQPTGTTFRDLTRRPARDSAATAPAGDSLVKRGPLVIWLLVAATALLVLAQAPSPPSARSPIVLDHANSLQVIEDQGARRQELRGAVRITKDSLIVTCEHAVYYPDSGILIFSDNVVFQDPNRILMADQVTYNELTEEVFARSRVRVYQHDTLSATARTARYFERLQQGWLYDDVQMRHENRRLLLTGDLGYANHDQEYGRVTGRPVMTERDSLTRILTRVRGDTIEYFGKEKRVRVTSRVKVERDSLTATGSLLDYWIGDHRAILLGAPEALRGEDHVTGDTLTLVFDGDTLKQVEVGGSAVVTSPADSGFAEPKNRMEGRHMTLWIDSGLVKEVLVEGTAIASYHPREKGEKRGLNITSGDRLRVFFENRRMARIRVEGGTQGTYTPQPLLDKPESVSSKQ